MTDVPQALSQPPSLGWAPPPWPGLSQWPLATGISGVSWRGAASSRSAEIWWECWALGDACALSLWVVWCWCSLQHACKSLSSLSRAPWREHATSCSVGSTCSFKATLLCSGSFLRCAVTAAVFQVANSSMPWRVYGGIYFLDLHRLLMC